MKLDDAEERDVLAAEYVLGTLDGTDRSRFERALQDDAGLRSLVSLWESRLAGLAAVVPAEAPPPEVWGRVQASLVGRAPSISDPDGRPLPQTPLEQMERSLRRMRLGLRIWQGIAAAAVAVALGLFAFQSLLPQKLPVVRLVAVLQPVDAGAAWLIEAAAAGATARPLSPPTLAPDKSFELWLVPSAGKPLSLGLLSDDKTTVLDLDPARRARLSPDALLAVSIEPSGGSATGAPTGPVVYSGRLAALGVTSEAAVGKGASSQAEGLPTQLTSPQRSNP